ncbi:MAG: hypothetical protein E3J37_01545 [Anaerolineales bacterium]|nr:MAG: hypothetical protein E3J37_01545 [Anaerolineales bacterium]
MFDSLFYALIGNWGRAVIGWALENPSWVFLGFALWLAVFGMGKLQLKGIREKTEAWVLQTSRQIVADTPDISIDDLYERLYPRWVDHIRGSAVFILHRWEIWPLPATPRFVKDRLDFTPGWLENYLQANGLSVRGRDPDKQKQPSSIKKR